VPPCTCDLISKPGEPQQLSLRLVMTRLAPRREPDCEIRRTLCALMPLAAELAARQTGLQAPDKWHLRRSGKFANGTDRPGFACRDSVIYAAHCDKLGGQVAVKVYSKDRTSASKLRAIKREAAMMVYLSKKRCAFAMDAARDLLLSVTTLTSCPVLSTITHQRRPPSPPLLLLTVTAVDA